MGIKRHGNDRGPIYIAPVEEFDFARAARALRILRPRVAPSEFELRQTAAYLKVEMSTSDCDGHGYGHLMLLRDGSLELKGYGTKAKSIEAWEKAALLP
jgi:hypothetical protein